MAGIEFTWDSRELDVFRGGKIEKALGRAMRLAGNQAIRELRQGTTDLVRRKKALEEATVKEDQALSTPNRKDELRDFVWTLWVKGQPVPVAKFPHIDTRGTRSRNGVLVRFGQGGTQRLQRAFVATMKSGHEGVFRRTRKARLPIEELFSSRLPANLGGEVLMTLSDPTYRKLETTFKRGLTRELGKLKRGGDL